MEQRPASWQPPHCPNRNCSFFNELTTGWRFKHAGYYQRQLSPNRIRRFRCLECGRYFSTQTFSVTYWMKKPHILAEVFRQTTSCAANRQISHNLKVAADTIDRAVGRLGRHCLLAHTDRWQLAPPRGPIAIDGLETFEWSQFFPFHANVSVEVEPGFFSYFTDSELRRRGRMTPWQAKRRTELEARLGRPDRAAVGRGITALLEVVLGSANEAIVRSDDHPAYRNPIRRSCRQVRHEVTSSRVRRDGSNALSEVNLLDGWIRHGSANHKRETIAWSKRRQRAMERLAIVLVDRNYLRSRRKKQGGPTPAMLRGLCDHKLEVEELLVRRLFAGKIKLPGVWQDYYDGRPGTRAIKNNREHRLRYAY